MNQPDDVEDVATFRIAYKNILGSNWTRWSYPWFSRAPRVRREFLGEDGMRASVYLLGEVNRRPERRSLKRMLRGWEVVRSKGCNNAYSDALKHRVVSQRELPLPAAARYQRYVTIVSYEHLETGIRWTAANTHLSSSGGMGHEVARKKREIEANVLVELCKEYDVDVLAGDLNNSSVGPATPRGIIEEAGFVDWRVATEVANAEYDTHHHIAHMPQRQSTHIDAIYLGPRVTVEAGRVQITEPDSSDHFGLVCTISIKR
jgi:endonuclease/exonuclease/phosphatase family metal-dependent hydrolase